jgi:hypothetical protein
MLLAVEVSIVANLLDHRSTLAGHRIAVLLPISSVVFLHPLGMVLHRPGQVEVSQNTLVAPTIAFHRLCLF